MSKVKTPSLSSVRVLAGNPSLGDATLPSSPIPLGASDEFTETLTEAGNESGGVRVVLGTQTSLVVVNDAKDPNVEGLFDLGLPTEAAAEDPAAAPQLSAPITFDPKRAYAVLTGISANGKFTGEGAAGVFALGLDASANLTVATCTSFDRATPVREAAEQVFNHFKTIFSREDLGQLRPEETLVLGFGGTLRLSVDVAASSLGDAIAGGLQTALGQATPVALSFSASAHVQLRVEIADGYRLYAQRGDTADELIFSVRKTRARLVGIDSSVGIKATFSDSVVLLQTVAEVFAQITGLPGELIQRAQKDLGVETLSAQEQELVEKAVHALKLKDPRVAPWQTLKSLVQEAQDRAAEIVPQKLTASLSYTWRRLTSDSYVARFRVNGSALKTYHTAILRLDLAELLAASKSGAAGVVFDSFLGKRVSAVEIGYGFSFGFNEFTFLKSWDSRSSRYIWQRDLDDRVQVSFLGRRGYDSTWLGSSQGHVVEVDASMPGFAAPPPAPADFEIGFHVAFTWKKQRFSSILTDVVDHAVMLGALPLADQLEAEGWLAANSDLAGQEGNATVSILVPPHVSQTVLARLAGKDSDLLLAYALARALPCGSFGRDFACRRNPDLRVRTYAPVWGSFLAHREMTLDALGLVAANQMTGVDAALARIEPDPDRNWGWSVRGIARNFGGAADLLEACDELRFACRKLTNRGDPGVDHRVFEQALKAGSLLWADHYGARVFGSLLWLAAGRDAGVLRRVERKVIFTWKAGGTDQVFEYKLGETV